MLTKKKLILLLCCVFLFGTLATLYYLIDPFYEEVVVTNHLIDERTVLSLEDLTTMKVPKRMINGDYYVQSAQVVGLITRINMAIPKGSFLYKNALQAQIKDDIDLLLEDGEVSYDLFVRDIKVNSAHLLAGMYIDLYLTINKDKVLSDLLISGCQISALYNAKNQKVKDYENDEVTIITVTLPKEQVACLNKALLVGSISVVVGEDPYSERETLLHQEGEVFAYVG